MIEVIFSIHTNYTKFVEQSIVKLMKKPDLQGFDDIFKSSKVAELSVLINIDYMGIKMI